MMTALNQEKKYSCKKVSPADAEAIHILMQQAFADYGSAQQKKKEITNSALEEKLEDIKRDLQENIVLVLTEGKQIVASLRLEEISEKRFLLKRFAVAPEYQNQGLGTMIFKEAVKELSSLKAHYLQLYSSLENNKLINFYQSLGFNCLETDQKKGYQRGLWVKTVK